MRVLLPRQLHRYIEGLFPSSGSIRNPSALRHRERLSVNIKSRTDALKDNGTCSNNAVAENDIGEGDRLCVTLIKMT